MSGTVPMVAHGSITAMNGLEQRPVYFVTLRPSTVPNLVVKGETPGVGDSQLSIHWSSKLMKHVNNRLVNTKIMTPQEIGVFKTFAQAHFPKNSKQYRSADINYVWVKMPMVQGLTDADIFVYQGQFGIADITKIKKAIKKLADDGVWADLGKVVAVDIFNGNCDRFDIVSGQWQNYGNVMFLAEGTTKVIGLDTFDRNAGLMSDLSSKHVFPELLPLIDKVKRKAFATASVVSVGTVFQRELKGMKSLVLPVQGPTGPSLLKIDVGKLPDFFLPYEPVFEEGIRLGAEQLKKYLQDKYKEYNQPGWQLAKPGRQTLLGSHRVAPSKHLPPGVIARMQYLGWLPV